MSTQVFLNVNEDGVVYEVHLSRDVAEYRGRKVLPNDTILDALQDERDVIYLEGPVTEADLERLPQGWMTCGTCHRAWFDDHATGVTPAPSGRCPFEYEHDEVTDLHLPDNSCCAEDDDDGGPYIHTVIFTADGPITQESWDAITKAVLDAGGRDIDTKEE